MAENLHQLLQSDDPVALQRIEKALMSSGEQGETVEAVISALIWRRCTAGPDGALGAILNHECAARISVMADHLNVVGADDCAQTLRDLRNEIPLSDAQIRSGIIDWVDVNPQLVTTFDGDVADIAPQIWNFMQK